MSNIFVGEGNIGIDPEVKVFTSAKNEQRFLLRLNVYFDNPVKVQDKYEDKGGFWASVEIWMGEEAKKWASIYQKGQRVLVQGRMIRDEWKDDDSGGERFAFKVRAQRVGILPFRIESVSMRNSTAAKSAKPDEPDYAYSVPSEFDDDIPF
jgi:single-strand DNA-binding protein